jgi:hypothetical protein
MKRLHYTAVIVLIFLIFHSLSLISSSLAEGEGWEILDNVTPGLDSVEWNEKGVNDKPTSWISDGRWYNAYSRQILVKTENYIFATFYENFNWTAVNASFEKEGWHPYERFEDFRSHILNDPGWWLVFSWNMQPEWLGISINRTKVEVELDPITSTVHVEITTYITNIPGYFIDTAGLTLEIGIGGEKLPKPLFAGYDLASLYIGDLDAFQLQEDYRQDGSQYTIHFRAPSYLMSQYKDTFSFLLGVAPQYWGKSVYNSHIMNISMPSNTVIKDVLPSEISKSNGNTVTFSLSENNIYPESFKITSGPPTKDFGQIFLENIGRWITEPEIWVAIITAIALVYAAFRGKDILKRKKTYYRLYKSMVNIFDRHSLDYPKFYQEIENLSKSITKYFIEDRINDEQFEKLFARRDDLIERAHRLKQS